MPICHLHGCWLYLYIYVEDTKLCLCLCRCLFFIHVGLIRSVFFFCSPVVVAAAAALAFFPRMKIINFSCSLVTWPSKLHTAEYITFSPNDQSTGLYVQCLFFFVLMHRVSHTHSPSPSSRVEYARRLQFVCVAANVSIRFNVRRCGSWRSSRYIHSVWG